MPSPADGVNRVVRTVIEAADPALAPVVKLRRFVVKRVELVARPDEPEPKGAAKRTGQNRNSGTAQLSK